MGNPSFVASEKDSSSKDPNSSSRGSRRSNSSSSSSILPRRRSASNLQHYIHASGGGSEILLHSQVTKLRIEEKYMIEEVETEGMERALALGQILSNVKDFSVAQHPQQQQEDLIRPAMPSPLGLHRTFAATG